jgi:hypothetical protein
MKTEVFGLLFIKFCSVRFIQKQFIQSRSVSCVNTDERIDNSTHFAVSWTRLESSALTCWWFMTQCRCCSTALFWALAGFSVSCTFTQSVELLGRVISPPQGRCLHTWQHKHRINAHRHPCLEWDSNPRSQCLSGRKSFLLQTKFITQLSSSPVIR